MKKYYHFHNYLGVIVLTLLTYLNGYGQDSNWVNLAFGAGGQIQDLYFDPIVPNRVYISSDQEGSYRSDDLGQTWNFIGKELSHGMSFRIKRDNSPNGRLFQGGLWGAHYSDDLGVNWTRIEPTKGDAISTMAFSTDNSLKVLAPGWHAKDPQKTQATIIDPIQPLIGERYVYVSVNGGAFNKKTYEPIPGYNHVFNVFVHPITDAIYIGSAAGVYVSTTNGNSWTRIANPLEAFRGEDGGIQTLNFFNGENVNTNKYIFSGGCSGMGFSPDGERIYAVYQTKGEAFGNRAEWKLFTALTANLSNSNQGWTVLEGLGNSIENGLKVQWYNPIVDPRSTTTDQHLIIGSNIKEGPNRVGLCEGTLSFANNGSLQSQIWQNILEEKLKIGSTNSAAFDAGWEKARFISRAYDYTPTTWGPKRIIAAGGNNFFLSNNEQQPNWPNVAQSWLPLYTTRIESATNGDKDTFVNNGFTNTVTYDIDTYENYAVQGNADQGILESFDFGISWTKETTPKESKNSQSIAIARTSPPIVIADSRNDFGIPSATELTLFARKLTDPTQQPSSSDWRVIGGGFNDVQLINGMANRQVHGITVDEVNVSRVYLGLRTANNSGGIYATEDIEGVYDGTSQWAEISNQEMSADGRFGDIFVDPNDSDVLWAAASNLWKGQRTGINKWTWEKYSTNIQDMHVWDNQGETIVSVATSIDNAPVAIYILRNPNSANWNNSTNFKPAGLNIGQTLSLRSEEWVEPNETITFGSMAGYGNTIYVGTENGLHKKGLGLFKGVFSRAGNGNVTTTWSDFTEDDQGKEFYYARTGNADAKIIREDNGDVNYYIPTFGTGIWRRIINSGTSDIGLAVSTSSITLSEAQNEVQEIELNVSGSWTISNIPNWIQINNNPVSTTLNGNGNTTLRFKTTSVNANVLPRAVTVDITSRVTNAAINITQLGSPLLVENISGTINIDGNIEQKWNQIAFTDLTNVIVGNSSNTNGKFKLAYTKDNLYILVDVDDTTPNSNFQDGQEYDGDAITIAFDVDNEKRRNSYGADDFVFKLTRDGNIIGIAGNAVNLVSDFATQSSGNGYVSEIAIAWNNLGILPGKGTPIGFDLAIEDNATNDGITHRIQFASGQELNTSLPSDWGSIQLNGAQIPWLENFSVPNNATDDTGITAWSVDTGSLSVDFNNYFKVNENRQLEARNLRGIESTFSSGAIDISSISEPLQISLRAKEKGANDDGYLRAFYKLDNGNPVLFDEITGDAPQDDTFLTLNSGVIPSGNSLQIIIRLSNSKATTFHTIDDILVGRSSASTCRTPADLVLLDIENNNTAIVTWRDVLGGSTGFTAQIREVDSNDPWQPLVQTLRSDEQYKSAALTTGKTYEWRVKKACGATETEFVFGERFTIPGSATQSEIFFREVFETNGCSTSNNAQLRVNNYPCYSNGTPIIYNGNAVLRTSNSIAEYEGASNGFSVLLHANTNNPQDKNIIIGNINTISSGAVSLSFGLRQEQLTNSSEGLIVDYRDGNIGGAWSVLDLTLPSMNDWTQIFTSLSNIPQTSNLELRFTAKMGSKYRLDDVELSKGGGSVPCSIISNVASSNVSNVSESLSWNATGSPSSFQVRIKPMGSNGWFLSEANGSSTQLDNLSTGTTYLVQIRALCGDESRSSWSPVEGFEYTFTAGDGSSNPNPSDPEVFFNETLDANNPPCGVSGGDFSSYPCYSESVTYTGSGAINSTNNNATAGDYENPSNGNNLFLSTVGKQLAIAAINANAYEAITLSFGVRKNNRNADGSRLLVEVTANGGASWSPLDFELPTTVGSNQSWQFVTLDTGIDTPSNFGVRFTNVTVNNVVYKFRLDDIRISGEPISSTALTVVLPDTPSEENSLFSIYPNPTSDFVTVSLSNIQAQSNNVAKEVLIYDMTGRLVKEYKSESSRLSTQGITLSVSTLKQGLYVLKTIFTDGRSAEKLLQIE
ncbi:putative secreted protein (Por secretion system target) [Flavobacteriaceae bacterium MAR_2009_75]|nr:putative secreted protein (Por secretion system target) [Flavobacteriaceae bacterium MAR_2009_75]